MQRFLNLTKDEPWVFGLPIGGEREFLHELGLDLREMFTIGGEDSAKRYLTRADGTQVGAQAIAEAMARMAARAREVANASPEVPQMSPERMREQQRLSPITWPKPSSQLDTKADAPKVSSGPRASASRFRRRSP